MTDDCPDATPEDLNLSQEDCDNLASTSGDVGNGLPSDDLTITISRVKDDSGFYYTYLNVNRAVRRLYAIGLVHEAMWMLGELTGEYMIPLDETWLDVNADGSVNVDEDDDGGDRASV